MLLDRYRLVDIARKVVGVGSVGTRSWMILLLEDGAEPAVPPGEGGRPLGAGGLRRRQRVRQRRAARRGRPAADAGRQRHLPRLDPGTGLRRAAARLLRAAAPRLEGLGGDRAMVPEGMLAYGELCGWTLARAHARWGDHAFSLIISTTLLPRLSVKLTRKRLPMMELDTQTCFRKSLWVCVTLFPVRHRPALYFRHHAFPFLL